MTHPPRFDDCDSPFPRPAAGRRAERRIAQANEGLKAAARRPDRETRASEVTAGTVAGWMVRVRRDVRTSVYSIYFTLQSIFSRLKVVHGGSLY